MNTVDKLAAELISAHIEHAIYSVENTSVTVISDHFECTMDVGDSPDPEEFSEGIDFSKLQVLANVIVGVLQKESSVDIYVNSGHPGQTGKHFTIGENI